MNWHVRVAGREHQLCMVSSDGKLQAYVKSDGRWWKWKVMSSSYSMESHGFEETEEAAKKKAADFISSMSVDGLAKLEREAPTDLARVIEGCLAALAMCEDGGHPKQHYVSLAKHLAQVSIRLATRLQVPS